MKYLLLTAVAFTLVCCGNSPKTKNSAEAKPLSFTVPEIPSMLEGLEAGNYIVAHYWDNFDFSDTAYVEVPEVTEQAFADYVHILNQADIDIARKAMYDLMTRARVDSAMHSYFGDLSEKYLYEPNSPFRNEELYIPVLQNIIDWQDADELLKLRPQAQLEMALKNRVGEKATDIEFTLADGRKMRLYDVQAEYLLLFINNPDCHACSEMTRALSSSAYLSPWFESGSLKVVAVYPDEDITAWRNYRDNMPREWINGYDADLRMRNEMTYDLKAIPTTYLLDKDKKVLVKDAGDAGPIESYFFYNHVL